MSKSAFGALSGFLLAALAAVLWGTTGTVQTFIQSPTLSPLWVGALRVLCACLFFYPALWVTEGRRAAPEKTVPQPAGSGGSYLLGVLAAGIAMALFNLLFFSGVKIAGVALGSCTTIGAAPVWAGILDGIVRRKAPDRLWVTGVAIAIAGGVWMAIFHSISAFCNAGFDILGTESNRYPSLTGYADSPVINITIMLLIVIGGIGFLTWDDIFENKWRFHRYRMQSKVILVTTGLLIFLPAVFFFFSDFSALPAGNRLLASFFQSVTPRTAGFNTVNLSAMSGASQGVMILLMLIGGSPGSTAGGMKTTTLAVLIANATATFRQRDSAQFFGRRVDCSAVKTAATILTMYLVLFFGGAVFISAYENLPLSACLYETASAVGTVGLTLGITPQLRIPSQMVLILLMYLGRVGGLTLIYAALSSKKVGNARLPQEKITIG